MFISLSPTRNPITFFFFIFYKVQTNKENEDGINVPQSYVKNITVDKIFTKEMIRFVGQVGELAQERVEIRFFVI